MKEHIASVHDGKKRTIVPNVMMHLKETICYCSKRKKSLRYVCQICKKEHLKEHIANVQYRKSHIIASVFMRETFKEQYVAIPN